MQGRVHRATERGGNYEIYLIMAGEAVAEFLALFDSVVGKRGIGDNMIFSAKIVDALERLV